MSDAFELKSAKVATLEAIKLESLSPSDTEKLLIREGFSGNCARIVIALLLSNRKLIIGDDLLLKVPSERDVG